ncbi:hypothetical protein QOZ80_6BG0493840 [Eleusine coracana subsp. coracana]|nr:hypothetical protein QOZ80_6BG0493840 [Eleusine coracana subsp. coracana]
MEAPAAAALLPWELTPTQYLFPPEVIIKSYVVLGSCILLSVTGQTGTYMFDTVTEQWAKLDDGDLPFAGGATPHGHLFLGFSRSSKEITLYKIAICASAASPSIKAECSSLSIAEFRVVADMEAGEHVASSGRFVSLGNHDNPGFCSFRCCSNNTAPFDFEHTRELVTMRTYTSESQDQLQSTRALLISKRWKQVYSICDTTRRLTCPCLEDVMSL